MAKFLSISYTEYETQVCVIGQEAGRPFKGKSGKIPHFFEPLDAFTITHPSTAIGENGDIFDYAEIGKNLSAKLKKRGVFYETAVVTLTNEKIVVRDITLPAVKPSKIDGLVSVRIKDWFPAGMDLSGYRISYKITEFAKTNVQSAENKHRISLIAVPYEVLEFTKTLISSAGLKILALNYAPISQADFYIANAKAGKLPETAVYVNIGEFSTSLIAIKDSALKFTRMIPFGVSDLVGEYLSMRNGIYNKPDEPPTRDEYLNMRYELCSPDALANHFVDFTDEDLRGLLNSNAMLITHGIRYYLGTIEDSSYESIKKNVGDVIICGAYRNYCQLEQTIKQIFTDNNKKSLLEVRNIDTERAFETKKLDIFSHINAQGSIYSRFDILSSTFNKVNKTRDGEEELTEAKKALKPENPAFMFLFFCVAASVGISAYEFLGAESARKEFEFEEKRSVNLSNAEKISSDYKFSLTLIKNKNVIEKKAFQNSEISISLHKFLSEFEEILPSGTSFSRMSYSENGIEIMISARSKDEAANIAFALCEVQALPFVTVRVTRLIEENEQTSFTVNCEFLNKNKDLNDDSEIETDIKTLIERGRE